MATEEVQLGAPQVVHRAGLGGGDESQSRVEIAGLDARLRGGLRAICPPCGIP